jgi:RNA polymerase sigma factor (TIGR02999 family)
LVNEAYLRLVGINRVEWQNRAHFFAIAGRQMRRILVDAARARGNQKRGGDVQKVSLSEGLSVPDRPEDVIALDAALEALTHTDERKARVVEMRFFAGLSVAEIAEVLNVSPDTVKRDWKLAKAWLGRELRKQWRSAM